MRFQLFSKKNTKSKKKKKSKKGSASKKKDSVINKDRLNMKSKSKGKDKSDNNDKSKSPTSKKDENAKSRFRRAIDSIATWAYVNRLHLITVLLLVVITIVVHAYNMFDYPYYENDEGTYLSRGWALLTEGKLDPYTYWYDHVPFASFILAGWIFLTGGVETFGMVVNSGRVFMLVLHVLDVILLYYIGWRMTGRRFMGVLAAILFTISPLSIYFYRRVLLDNIIIFFMLATLAILIKKKLTLRWIFLSGVTFAIGVLTKENVAIFIPVYLGLIFFRTKGTRRLLGSFNWLVITGGLISLYFFYALLKQEFFPPGVLGTPEESVSLLHTLTFHLGRGSELPFWEEGSDFMGNFRDWIDRDLMLIALGLVTTVILIPISIKNKWARILLAISLVHIWFLIRGGLILNFYIMPVLPFLALNIGFVFDWLIDYIHKNYKVPKYYYYVVITILIGAYLVIIPKTAFVIDENEANREMVAWARENLNGDEMIVADNAIFLDLRAGSVKFENTEWFYKVDTDPEVFEDKLKEDWKNIDYIFLSHETVKQLASGNFVYIQNALENSPELARWEENSTAFVNVNQYLSTNGDWGRIYKVPSASELRKDKTWENVIDNYVISYGQIYNPISQQTTSYMQTNGMYQAVLSDDKQSFNNLRGWTQDHFSWREDDELLSSVWSQADVESDGVVIDTNSMARADVQYAASLLMAYELWGDQKYLTEAMSIIPDIWEFDVIEIRGRYYLGSGSNAAIYNPSKNIVDSFYIDLYAGLPEYIELFEKYDPETDWEFLLEDWYLHASNVLASRNEGQETEIFPETALLALDGSIVPYKPYDPSNSSNTMLLLSLYNSRFSEPIGQLMGSLNGDLFTEEEFENQYVDTIPPSNISSSYLISDLINLDKGTIIYDESYFNYLDEKGFSFESGEWKYVNDLTNHYNVWVISYLLDKESTEDD